MNAEGVVGGKVDSNPDSGLQSKKESESYQVNKII